MRITDTEIKEIIKLLERLSYSMGVETVFRDWCECAALAFANGCDLLHGPVWEKREKRYLSIIGKYKEAARAAFLRLFSGACPVDELSCYC